MNPDQLLSLANAQILDVRLDDDYEAEHIAGAENNCVFEVAFVSRLATSAPEFTAAAGLTAEGKPAAQAAFSIDRTRWGILYGSGRFFKRLAGHVVNDMLEFQIRIITK